MQPMKRHSRDPKRLEDMTPAELRALAAKLRSEPIPPPDPDDDSARVVAELLDDLDGQRDMLTPEEIDELRRDKKETAAWARKAYKLGRGPR
jgi:hypothetical protein